MYNNSKFTKFLFILNFFTIFINISSNNSPKLNIGVCVMATGRYIEFIPSFIEHAKKNFLTNHNITFYIFTDGKLDFIPDKNIKIIYQKKLGWPYDSLDRFSIYKHHANTWSFNDFMFSVDADIRFINKIGEEILSERVGVLHPCFINKRGSYESKNKRSTAYISKHEGTHYFTGAFYGGNSREFYNLITILSNAVNLDKHNQVMPIWHDESQLNRYFVDNKPTKILPCKYYYPELWPNASSMKVLALEKNHNKMRK